MNSRFSLGVARGRIVRTVASMAATLAAVTALIELTRAQPPAPKPTMPIKQLMETVITDASNAIWAASDPPSFRRAMDGPRASSAEVGRRL